jgi:hypothetical protein
MRAAWGSFWDERSRAPLRIGIATIAAVELFVESWQIDWQARDPDRYPPTGALAETLAAIPGAAFFVYAMILVGLVALALDRRPVAAGVWALAWGGLQSEWQTQIFGSPSRNAFFPGAAVLGWTLGQAWAHAVAIERATTATRAVRERLAEAGALACIAAAYVGSCLSKLLASGLAWGDGAQVRALVLWQHPIADWAWLAAYRDAIVHDDAAASAASIATLVVEGGAFLLLFGPRLRLLWATLIVGLHVNITLLCTMPYLEPMALLVLMTPPWRGLFGGRSEPAILDGPRFPKRAIALLAGVVILAWLLQPWGWRAERIDPNPAWSQ